jgi:hypothetical protein
LADTFTEAKETAAMNMKINMNKKERVDAALASAAVDGVPISFWGHSYLKEWSAEELSSVVRDLRLGLRQQPEPVKARACVSLE